MIVAGCDLSYTRSACVFLDEKMKVVTYFEGAIKSGPKRHLRALKLYRNWLFSLAPLDLVVIEDNAYGAPSRVVVAKLAALNALCKTAAEHLNIDWLEVSPSALKKAITGKGTAEKAQVAQELKRLYGIHFADDKGFDLSDAAAAAVWGVKHRAERT